MKRPSSFAWTAAWALVAGGTFGCAEGGDDPAAMVVGAGAGAGTTATAGVGGGGVGGGGVGGGGVGGGGVGGGGVGGGVATSCAELPSGWTPISTEGAPSPRHDFAWAWTGQELLVWGGAGTNYQALGDGARFDVATMTWKPLAMAGAPPSRSGPSSVWTGEELWVWGGMANALANQPATGAARYAPATDSWSPMTGTAEALRNGAWTGSHVLSWASTSTSVGTWMRYDASLDAWSPLAVDPGARPFRGVQAWAGSAYVFAGLDYAPEVHRYDPLADAWTAMTGDAHLQRFDAGYTSTPDHFVIFGGGWADQGEETTYYFDGARYEVASDSWTAIPIAPIPIRNVGLAADDDSVLVVGCLTASFDFDCVENVALRYDFATGKYVNASPGGALGPPRWFRPGTAVVVPTSCGTLVWGGMASTGGSSQPYAVGAIYRP